MLPKHVQLHVDLHELSKPEAYMAQVKQKLICAAAKVFLVSGVYHFHKKYWKSCIFYLHCNYVTHNIIISNLGNWDPICNTQLLSYQLCHECGRVLCMIAKKCTFNKAFKLCTSDLVPWWEHGACDTKPSTVTSKGLLLSWETLPMWHILWQNGIKPNNATF